MLRFGLSLFKTEKLRCVGHSLKSLLVNARKKEQTKVKLFLIDKQAIAKCFKKVIELQVQLLHQNVTEY